MQFAPLTFALVVVLALALAIGLAAAFGSPLIAAPIVIAGIVVFLIQRGARRTEHRSRVADVPSTAEAAADPARDSGAQEAQVAGAQRPADSR